VAQGSLAADALDRGRPSTQGLYLIDVLQRIAVHPANPVEWLASRLRKENFAEDLMRSIVAGLSFEQK